MEYALHHLIHWPDRESLQTLMPASFTSRFGKGVTVIIDCFEIRTEKPSSLRAQALSYSNYKGTNTAKFLIGISPQGCIIFISDGWAGRTSDKKITSECGILDNLIPGDIILADRGFTVHELVSMHFSTLKTPAFTKGKKQLHPKEIEDTRKLASVRVHVERVIGIVR